MLDKDLENYGFSKNESTVYIFLLEKGKTKAGEIIRETKLQRSVVYGILSDLVVRELVTKVEYKGVALFSVNDPKQLVAEAESKKGLAERIAMELAQKQKEAPREIAVYEGLDGIMKATDKNLLASEGETVYILGASSMTVQPTLNAHWKSYHAERIKKKISFKILYDRSVGEENLADRNKLPLAEARYLPFGMEMSAWFNICADRVAIMIPSEDPPVVFSMRSKNGADAMKKFFEFLWTAAAPLRQKSNVT